MQDSKSLLPFPNALVGSYAYAYKLVARADYLSSSTILQFSTIQEGGGAFTVVGNSQNGYPTIFRTKIAGLYYIGANCISADDTALAFNIAIRQPGDSTMRFVTDVSIPSGGGGVATRQNSSIILPLPEGAEIMVSGGSVRTALDESQDQMYLVAALLCETNLRTNVRYGS